MLVDYAAPDWRSNPAHGQLRLPVNVSLADKFARSESQDSAIPFTKTESSVDQPARYPRFLWISLSKKPLHKCVSLGFPRPHPVAQKLGTKSYIIEIMGFH
jgi:hypothetical protein